MATDDLHTSVWWDLDDCPFPKDWDCRDVGSNIRLAIQRMGYDGPTTVDACGSEVIDYPVPVVQSLARMMSLFALAQGSEKRIKSGMKKWVGRHPAPANFTLIAEHIGSYSSTLDELRTQNYNIFLAFPGLDDGPSALTHLDILSTNHVKTATFVWNLLSLVRGGPPLLSNGIEFEVDETNEDNIAMFEDMRRISTLIPRCDSNANTSIWWDIEECPVPKNLEDGNISFTKNIAAALRVMDYLDCPFTIETALKAMDYNGGSISFFIDTSRIRAPFFSEDKDYIKFVHTGYTRKERIAAMKAWAEENPAPANIMLISRDRAYISTLLELNSKKYKILLAHTDEASPDLVAAASCVWILGSLVVGGKPYSWSDGSEPYHKKFYQEEEAIPHDVLASEARFAFSKKRRSVGSLGDRLFGALECMHNLTDEEEILVAKHLFLKTDDLDLFFLLPVEKRVVMARMIIDERM